LLEKGTRTRRSDSQAHSQKSIPQQKQKQSTPACRSDFLGEGKVSVIQKCDPQHKSVGIVVFLCVSITIAVVEEAPKHIIISD
jgi:hypothetical protein